MRVDHLDRQQMFAVLGGCMLGVLLAGPAFAEPGIASHLGQVAPLRPDAVRVPAPADLPKETAVPPATPVPASMPPAIDPFPGAPLPALGGYDPAGRRDPFTPVLSQLAPGQVDPSLPPLQRISLTDMNLIAIIWGAYGYTAMVQTPDGNGYTVRKGTRVGPNSGVVSAVTEKGIIVQERFTDVYGRKQEREYVKLLHPKEGLE